jgi:hypothetical protein
MNYQKTEFYSNGDISLKAGDIVTLFIEKREPLKEVTLLNYYNSKVSFLTKEGRFGITNCPLTLVKFKPDEKTNAN